MTKSKPPALLQAKQKEEPEPSLSLADKLSNAVASLKAKSKSSETPDCFLSSNQRRAGNSQGCHAWTCTASLQDHQA